MFKKIAIAVAILIAGLLAFAATKPDTFSIERKTVIKAPAEKIFPYVADFHQWSAWSPYEKLDPNMKRTYSGPATGVGAAYGWEGNKDVGAGRMEITEVEPASKLVFKLDFIKPMEANNTGTFAFAPKDGAVEVTWGIHGPQPYLSKVMCIFFDMDKMVGKDFEAGLASLKTLAESQVSVETAAPAADTVAAAPETKAE